MMAEQIKKLLFNVLSSWLAGTLAGQITLGSILTALSTYLLYATKALSSYAPFSYLVAVSVAAMLSNSISGIIKRHSSPPRPILEFSFDGNMPMQIKRQNIWGWKWLGLPNASSLLVVCFDKPIVVDTIKLLPTMNVAAQHSMNMINYEARYAILQIDNLAVGQYRIEF
jgi:hypothetical protein